MNDYSNPNARPGRCHAALCSAIISPASTTLPTQQSLSRLGATNLAHPNKPASSSPPPPSSKLPTYRQLHHQSTHRVTRPNLDLLPAPNQAPPQSSSPTDPDDYTVSEDGADRAHPRTNPSTNPSTNPANHVHDHITARNLLQAVAAGKGHHGARWDIAAALRLLGRYFTAHQRNLLESVVLKGVSVSVFARLAGLHRTAVTRQVRQLLKRLTAPMFRFILLRAHLLSRDERAAAIECYIKGHSQRAAAFALQIHLSTLRRRLAAAHKKMIETQKPSLRNAA